MNKKFFLPLLLAAAVCLPSHGQSTGENEGRFRQDYLPVSPTTAALMRCVQCPVNYSTGRIDLSIPLYEIRTRDFTLPLTLRYAGGGVKVDDTDDVAGLGWTLDFGPTMGRSIQGMPDERGYLNYNSLFGSNNSTYLEALCNGGYDEMPDVFYYSTLDEQGCFVYKRPESGSPASIALIPLTSVQIEAGGFQSNGFTVKDGNGNVYQFSESEYSDSDKLTGWKLKTLTSPKGDRMDFSYTQCMLQTSSYYDYYATEDRQDGYWDLGRNGYWKACNGSMSFFRTNGYEQMGDSLWGNFTDDNPDLTNLSYEYVRNHTVQAKYPSQIAYEGGRVTFDYDVHLLSAIHVYEGNIEVQRITFSYEKRRFGPRSFLTGITFTELAGNKSRSYAMSYQKVLSDYAGRSNAVDLYGYYNGHDENTDRVERRIVEFTKPYDGTFGTYYGYIGGADRTPDAHCASNFSISSLRYPNGETESYLYELNTYKGYDYDGNETELYAGGIRIKEIGYKDIGNNRKSVRRFVYDEENVHVPEVQYEETVMKYYIEHNQTQPFRYRLYPSLPVADAGSVVGLPILYSRVTELTDDANGNPVASRTYTYESNDIFPYINNGMVHDNVRSFRKGLTADITDTEPGSGDTLRILSYTHGSLYGGNSFNVPGRSARQLNILVPSDGSVDTEPYKNFVTAGYYLRVDNEHPVVTRETLTDAYGGRPTTRTTERTFGGTENDVRTALPLTETVREADGTRRRTCYTYPYHSTEAAAQAMTAANDLKRPLSVRKETLSADGDSVQDWRTDFTYKTLSGVGSAVLSAAASGGHEGSALTDESYTAHDAQGNICEIRRRDGSLTTVLYGYHYRHPVAVIEGAAYSDVIAALGISYTALQDLTGTTLRNRLLGLRTAFPAPCRVTVYDYAPTRGPVYRNDPNGNVTTWSYDGFGRMTEARDAEGAVMQYNEYGEY